MFTNEEKKLLKLIITKHLEDTKELEKLRDQFAADVAVEADHEAVLRNILRKIK